MAEAELVEQLPGATLGGLATLAAAELVDDQQVLLGR